MKLADFDFIPFGLAELEEERSVGGVGGRVGGHIESVKPLLL